MANYKTVAAIQFSTRCECESNANNRDAVLQETRQSLAQVAGYGLDLLVLCEGIEAYGQTLDQAESLAQPGPFLSLYAAFARQEKLTLVGSAKVRDAAGVHNSAVAIGPDGRTLGCYHKTFLTRGEQAMGLIPGQGPVVLDTPVGRLGFAICFDLNFPTLRQGYGALKPDIIAFPSMFHGGLAQQWWACENRAFMVSATYFAGCGIYDPFGRPVKCSDEYTLAPMARINLDGILVHLDLNRDKFPAIKRRYRDEVLIDIPPHAGSARIVSESDKRTACQIADEFGLIRLDDYLRDSAAENEKRRVTAYGA